MSISNPPVNVTTTAAQIAAAATTAATNTAAPLNADLDTIAAGTSVGTADLIKTQYDNANYQVAPETDSAALASVMQTMQAISRNLNQV